MPRRSTRFDSYAALVEARTPEERLAYAQVKRFAECLSGDPEFADRVRADTEDPWVRDYLGEIGVTVPPRDLEPLLRDDGCSGQPGQDVSAQPPAHDLARWPLAELWAAWVRDQADIWRQATAAAREAPVLEARFDAWRRRRVAQVKSELGSFGMIISHAVFCYELSRGCSAGCWFCAFAAKPLAGVFQYTPENRRLFMDVARAGRNLLGNMSNCALAYYGTEPSDNPHYVDFLRDLQETTGAILNTSTAKPEADPAWTRRLLEFYGHRFANSPRFSVLSTKALRQIHRTFSPQELRDTELLLQMRCTPMQKARSGRTLKANDSRLGGKARPDGVQGSISCLSGFLVNMVDRSIRLVSPCQASERWPLGYRVYGEAGFEDAASYRRALEVLIAEHIPDSVTPRTRLAFRDDLCVTPTAGGIVLTSPRQEHTIDGAPWAASLGRHIAAGDRSLAEISQAMAADGVSPLAVAATVHQLFSQGLLDETHGGQPGLTGGEGKEARP